MAAQSEAASIKVSPFSMRRLRAVLYSTSGRLASWSFLLPGQVHMDTERDPWRSLRNRGSRGPAGGNPINELTILDNGNAVNKHKRNSLGALQRLFIHAVVDDRIRLENSDFPVLPHA